MNWKSTVVRRIESGEKISRKMARELGLAWSTLHSFVHRDGCAIKEKKKDKRVVPSFYVGKNVQDNSSILLISDMHIPYHHKNTLEFLSHLKDKYKPTRIVCLGDELDHHALSFHDSDADLLSAGDELKKAQVVVKKLEKLFPKMDLLDSNHGSLIYRRAKHHGIPKQYIKGYNEILGVGEGWKWHNDMILYMPNGEPVYFCHGKAQRGVQLSQNMGMSVVQGHHHSEFNIHYWSNPIKTFFSLQCGSLVDDTSLAMEYNKLTLKRPIVGTAVIIDGKPILEMM